MLKDEPISKLQKTMTPRLEVTPVSSLVDILTTILTVISACFLVWCSEGSTALYDTAWTAYSLMYGLNRQHLIFTAVCVVSVLLLDELANGQSTAALKR